MMSAGGWIGENFQPSVECWGATKSRIVSEHCVCACAVNLTIKIKPWSALMYLYNIYVQIFKGLIIIWMARHSIPYCNGVEYGMYICIYTSGVHVQCSVPFVCSLSFTLVQILYVDCVCGCSTEPMQQNMAHSRDKICFSLLPIRSPSLLSMR